MIDRYTTPEMGAVWSAENRYRKWLDVELAVCEVQAVRGAIPADAMEAIRARAGFDAGRIDEIEATVQHDMIAFLTDVGEKVGPAARYIHMGMTSSDVLDTATSLQLRDSGRLLDEALAALREALRRRALEHKDTVCIGRTHGVHAEPTTFGLKCALWYDETGRGLARLGEAVRTVSVGKVSGAVGTFAHLDPEVEEAACARLGLAPAPVSTQVIQRDRHAAYLATLAVIGGTLEKIAVEIRHLQRTEVLEAEEYFGKGQKGSSAMPHKRNPIVCERIAGLARLLRGYAVAAMENQALWHERDISHSSVERVILPDANILLHYMLRKATGLVDRLQVYPERMRLNLEATRGLIFSQALLLALVSGGLSREEAYRVVQDRSMQCWRSGASFRDAASADETVNRVLDDKALAEVFDLSAHLRNVDRIYRRVGLIP